MREFTAQELKEWELLCAGVNPWDEEGNAAFKRFMQKALTPHDGDGERS